MRKYFIILCALQLLIESGLLARGYICAVGGGTENKNEWSDEPYRWMVEKAENGSVLVLHYSRGSTWLEDYFKGFGASSAQSLVISNPTEANSIANYDRIKAAKLIFLRGGNQYEYYTNWKGTLAEQALREVYADGGVIGGTSAGLAVLGEIDYIAANASARSNEGLLNPFNRDITLADDFLPLVPGVIFDSHFTKRARFGRLLAFVAHWNTIQSRDILGIGVDEHTAVCIAPDGKMTVTGAGSAVLVHANPDSRIRCQASQPLFFTNWTVHALTPGFSFDLNQRILVAPAEGAQLKNDVLVPVHYPAAKLLLDGSDSPSSARSRLTQMCQEAAEQPIVLLTGENDTVFNTYLTSALNYDPVQHIPLTSENLNAETSLQRVEENQFFILAALPLQEWERQSLFQSPLIAALQTKLQTPATTLLCIGESVGALGSLAITNLDTGSDNLENGKFLTASGLDVFQPVHFMTQAFELDSDAESRKIGGFFWQAFQKKQGLGFLLDVGAAAEFSGRHVRIQSRIPVLITDMQHVTWLDSSDYKIRAYYHPRQSAGFYGARLHCLPADSTVQFNLEKRTCEISTGMPGDTQELHNQVPDHFRIDVFPNPASEELQFVLNSVPRGADYSLEIFDLLGRRVFQQQLVVPRNFYSFRWSPSSHNRRKLPSGIYFVVVKSDAHFASQKFSFIH